MAAVHLQTIVAEDGTLTVHGLPTLAGHKVDVVVRDCAHEPSQETRYSLRGKKAEYRDPFRGVAEGDWDAIR